MPESTTCIPPLKDNKDPCEKTDHNLFTIQLNQNCKITISKPLIPLKLAQFCWFGAGSYMVAFLTVFLKQRGISLAQLSFMNVVAPIVQLTGTSLSGVAADKLGRAKPVLVTNLLLVSSILVGLILMPGMNAFCETQPLNISCSKIELVHPGAKLNCSMRLDNCVVQCSDKSLLSCKDKTSSCFIEVGDVSHRTFPAINSTFVYNQSCYFDVLSTKSLSLVNNWCNHPQNESCQLSCQETDDSNCDGTQNYTNKLLYGYAALFVLFVTCYSNTYRCFDVTAMTLTKEHNGDFGVERFFAITGNLMISPLAGYLVDATTEEGGVKNYVAGFYLFFGMVGLVLIILFKLPVTVNTPGEKMGRKTFELLKNVDIVSLMIVILTLGTAWNFTKIYLFWYLSDMNAPSVLVGLIPSVSAFYGLPFLLTSKWWIRKAGSTQLIIHAFIGYAAMCTGYSFLSNPWYSIVLEMFGGITYYLLWVAVVEHCHELAPDGMKATVVAVAGAIHYSIGKATGGLVGGLVMSEYGGKWAFRLIAVICLVMASLYFCFLFIRHNNKYKQHKLENSEKSSPGENKLDCIFVVHKTPK